MRLRRLAVPVFTAAAIGLAFALLADAAAAKSSLGIGTAEVTAAPTGPFAALFIEINAYQRDFFTSLRQTLVRLKSGPDGMLMLVGLSFLYGVFHAAGPGHGKAVISSYVLANEVQLRRGIALAFVSALLQAATAIFVAAGGWFLLRGTGISTTQVTDGLEIASYALIAVFGGWLVLRKLGRIVRRSRQATPFRFATWRRPPGRGVTAALSFEAVPRREMSTQGTSGFGSLPGTTLSRPRGTPMVPPASEGMAAGICGDEGEDCACGRPHMPDPRRLATERLSFGSAASAVFAVGLRPCTGAVTVLAFALVNGLFIGGALSVLAMAFGTAITVSLIATIAVYGKGTALRLGSAGGFGRWIGDGIELIGALLVLVLGLALLGGALQ